MEKKDFPSMKKFSLHCPAEFKGLTTDHGVMDFVSIGRDETFSFGDRPNERYIVFLR